MNEVTPSVAAPAAVEPLSRRADFTLGGATVRPSLRTIEGPLGTFKGEPRVIQVLVALADARGRVLSREDLLQCCWEGRIVGDDAINRAVAEVRRIAAAAGAGFEVETVPRVGYRLSGLEWDAPSDQSPVREASAPVDRRTWLIGGAAVLAAGAGGPVYLARRRDSRADRLVEKGRRLQASGQPHDEQRAKALFREAVAIDPARADAWGLLAALALGKAEGRELATHALELDPREPNARAVVAVQRRDLDDWTRFEDELLSVLSDDPENSVALPQLTLFYQGMGRCRDSLLMNERVIRVEPFNPSHQARRALKHWIFGRVDLADQVANRALQLWPRNSNVWNARLITYAFTDRASATRALLTDGSTRPVNLTEASASAWSAAVDAIESRSPRDIARALEANTEAATRTPGGAANAVMIFSYLGELDAAYQVAEGLLTGRGPVVQRSRVPAVRDLYAGEAWGRTQFLFVPAAAAFRADERFPDLCERMGHMAYWRQRGVWPDPFVRGALATKI